MKVEFLASPSANKTARAALQTASVLFLVELPDGSFVLGDRGQNCFIILDDLPTREELQAARNLLHDARITAEARFYGEPDARTLARDIRLGERPPTIPRSKTSVQSIDIEF